MVCLLCGCACACEMRLCCPVLTHGACEWFVSLWVRMCCEIALSSPVLTHGACEWFVSCVGAHVPCEIALSSCPVLTHGACEWFVSCVGAHVLCEIALLSCPVLTHGACEWFVSCVGAHVLCEMALFSCPVACCPCTHTHTVHANGLSPVWVRMCLVRLLFELPCTHTRCMRMVCLLCGCACAL